MKPNEELKPCPFCGGEGKLVRRSVDRWWHIECTMCHARTMVTGRDKNKITRDMCFKLWNTRPTLPTQGLDVDILSNFIRSFDGNHDKGAGEIAEAIVARFGKPSQCEHEWEIINGGTHCKKCLTMQAVLCSTTPKDTEKEDCHPMHALKPLNQQDVYEFLIAQKEYRAVYFIYELEKVAIALCRKFCSMNPPLDLSKLPRKKEIMQYPEDDIHFVIKHGAEIEQARGYNQAVEDFMEVLGFNPPKTERK